MGQSQAKRDTIHGISKRRLPQNTVGLRRLATRYPVFGAVRFPYIVDLEFQIPGRRMEPPAGGRRQGGSHPAARHRNHSLVQAYFPDRGLAARGKEAPSRGPDDL